jgi:hypothetical protein
MLAAAALRARRATRAIFTAELLSLPVMFLGLALVPTMGIHGVVLGTLAADLALLGLQWRAYGSQTSVDFSLVPPAPQSTSA